MESHLKSGDTISVCMATYNGAAYVREQIDSIVAQLGPADELLVADDGSSDATVAIVNSYGGIVKLVATGKSGGVVTNFERCLGFARNEIIMLADQDDVWLPGRVELVRQQLQHADCLMLNGLLVDGQLRSLGKDIFSSVAVSSGFAANLTKNTFVGCCMAFRASLLEIALPFPKGIAWHDWYLGLLAELTMRVKRVNEATIYFRRHGGNASATGEKSANSLPKKLAMRWTMLRAVIIARYRRGGRA